MEEQKQNKNKFHLIRLVYRYRWMYDIRRIQQQKTKQKQVPPDFPAITATKTKQKQVPPDFLPGGIPADPATKIKQKQVPLDFQADPATKTKQKQVPPDFLVYRFRWMSQIRQIQQQKHNKNQLRWIFRRIERQKQNKNKFRRLFFGVSI
jgi:hypothetical protein